MIPAQFKNADPLDELFADVGVIVCNPPCSLSAVQQPIDYIIQEGGTYFILRHNQNIYYTHVQYLYKLCSAKLCACMYINS